MKRSELQEFVQDALDKGHTDVINIEDDELFENCKDDKEKFGALYAFICQQMMMVAVYEGRFLENMYGSCNQIYASPNIVAIIERPGKFSIDTAPIRVEELENISLIGKLINVDHAGHEIDIYRDAKCKDDYILLRGNKENIYVEVDGLDDLLERIFPLYYPTSKVIIDCLHCEEKIK